MFGKFCWWATRHWTRLAGYWSAGKTCLDLRTSSAPYGQVFQILLDGTHPLWASKPDILVVWTAPNLTLPSVARLLRFEFESAPAEHEAALRDVEQFADAVIKAAKRVGLVLVPTWMLPTHERWIQTLTWRHGVGISNLLAKANLMLAEKFCSGAEHRPTGREILAGELIQVGVRSAHVCGRENSLLACPL